MDGKRIALTAGREGHCRFKDMPSAKLIDLPVDILIDIASRLPATSLLRLQCVCRTLRNVVNDPALVSLYLRYKTTIQDLELPQLRVLYSDHERKRKYKLEFVYCGLLGFTHVSGGPLFLFNPLRSELIQLPAVCEVDYQVRRSKVSECYSMGFDAVSNSLKLVHVYDHKGSISPVAHVHILGTKSWRRIPSVPPCRCKTKMNVFANGKMHWLVDHHRRCDMRGNWIVCFDIEKEEYGWTPHPMYPGSLLPFGLISMKGSMTLVNITRPRSELELWTLQADRHRWKIDCSIDLDKPINPIYRYEGIPVRAWEHGIALVRSHRATSALEFGFYDLRSGNTICTILDFHMPSVFDIFEFTPSLISLKKYGDLLRSTKWPTYISKLKIQRIKQQYGDETRESWFKCRRYTYI